MLPDFIARLFAADPPLLILAAACSVLALAAVIAWVTSTLRDVRSQRRYRAALARRDWDEVHRLMGFKE